MPDSCCSTSAAPPVTYADASGAGTTGVDPSLNPSIDPSGGLSTSPSGIDSSAVSTPSLPDIGSTSPNTTFDSDPSTESTTDPATAIDQARRSQQMGNRQRGERAIEGSQAALGPESIQGANTYSAGADDLPAAAYNTAAEQAGMTPQGGAPNTAESEAGANGTPTPEELNERFGRYGLTPEDIQTIATAGLTPQELDELDQRLSQETGVPMADPAASSSEVAGPAGPTEAAGAAAGGWGPKWEQKFTDLLKSYGIPQKGITKALNGLKGANLTDAQLQQQYDYYTKTPEGQQELMQAAQAAQMQQQQQQGAGGMVPPKMKKLLLGGSALAATAAVGRNVYRRVVSNRLAQDIITARDAGNTEAARAAEQKLAAMKGKTARAHAAQLGIGPAAAPRAATGARAVELFEKNAARGGLLKGTDGLQNLGEITDEKKLAREVNKVVRANPELDIKGTGRGRNANAVLDDLAKAGKVNISGANHVGTFQYRGSTINSGVYHSALENKRATPFWKAGERGPASRAAFRASAGHQIYSDASTLKRFSPTTATKAIGAEFAAVRGGGPAATASGSALKGAGHVLRGSIGGKLGVVGAVASAGFGAYDTYQQYKKDGEWSKEVSKKAGKTVGETVGGVAGAALGATALGWIPGGAIVGGLVGGYVGYKLGGWVGEHAGGVTHDIVGGAKDAWEGVKGLF